MLGFCSASAPNIFSLRIHRTFRANRGPGPGESRIPEHESQDAAKNNVASTPKLLSLSRSSFVYRYPSVSQFARRNSDHGPSKAQTKTQTTPDSAPILGQEKLTGEGKLRLWSKFGVFLGQGQTRGPLIKGRETSISGDLSPKQRRFICTMRSG